MNLGKGQNITKLRNNQTIWQRKNKAEKLAG
jgi:hypothetical protein